MARPVFLRQPLHCLNKVWKRLDASGPRTMDGLTNGWLYDIRSHKSYLCRPRGFKRWPRNPWSFRRTLCLIDSATWGIEWWRFVRLRAQTPSSPMVSFRMRRSFRFWTLVVEISIARERMLLLHISACYTPYGIFRTILFLEKNGSFEKGKAFSQQFKIHEFPAARPLLRFLTNRNPTSEPTFFTPKTMQTILT
jgi:hypothetical protein